MLLGGWNGTRVNGWDTKDRVRISSEKRRDTLISMYVFYFILFYFLFQASLGNFIKHLESVCDLLIFLKLKTFC